MTDAIDNSADVLDSRDIIARIEELTTQRDEAEAEAAEGHAAFGYGKAERDELAALEELQAEAELYAPDWEYGAQLIRESYFVDYCKELLEDCGDLPKDLPGYIAIDWEKTADNIMVDYTGVEFDGVTYLVR